MRNFRTGPASVRSMLAITIKYRPLSRPERTWDTQRLPSTETPSSLPHSPHLPHMHSLTHSLTHSPPFLVIPSLYTSFPSNPSPSGQSLLIWCISFLLIPSHNPFQLHFYHCWFGGGLSDTLSFSLSAKGLPHTMHVSLSKSIMGLRFAWFSPA